MDGGGFDGYNQTADRAVYFFFFYGGSDYSLKQSQTAYAIPTVIQNVKAYSRNRKIILEGFDGDSPIALATASDNIPYVRTAGK